MFGEAVFWFAGEVHESLAVSLALVDAYSTTGVDIQLVSSWVIYSVPVDVSTVPWYIRHFVGSVYV